VREDRTCLVQLCKCSLTVEPIRMGFAVYLGDLISFQEYQNNHSRMLRKISTSLKKGSQLNPFFILPIM